MTRLKGRSMLSAAGVELQSLAFGCWRFGEATAADVSALVRVALDTGHMLIDTADIYGFGEAGFGANEALLGDALRADPSLRARMILATKGGIEPGSPYNSSRAYLFAAVEASLTRLAVETIDLYQIHRPDLLTGFAELADTLDALVASGKVRTIGVSNFTVSEIRALAAHLKAPIVSVQNEFSALTQTPMEDGVLDWCQETGATFFAWSPLAGGRLFASASGADADVIAALDRAADALETDRASAALAFLLTHPADVVPIVGTMRPERVREAAAAAKLRLPRRAWYDVVEARRGRRMP